MNIAKRFGLVNADERTPVDLAVANPLRGDDQEPKPHHRPNLPSATGRPTGIASESSQSSQKEAAAGATFSGLNPLATSKIACSRMSLHSTATLTTLATTSQQTLGLKLSEIIRFASAAPESISTAEFGRRWVIYTLPLPPFIHVILVLQFLSDS